MTELLVWFDGDCPLCQREIALMRRLDRRRVIQLTDISPGGLPDCPIDRAMLLERFHAREGWPLGVRSGRIRCSVAGTPSGGLSPDETVDQT